MKKSGITALKVKVTAKVQNVSECLLGRYLLNHRTFVTKPSMLMQHHKPECHAEKNGLLCDTDVKVTAGAYIIQI